MKRIVLLLIFTIPMLCGCYDYNDVENLSYVTAVSVDSGSNSYEYTFQFVNPLSDEGEVVTYSAEGNSLYEAVGVISKELTRKVSFTHIKMIAVSQEAAKDMGKAVDGFNSSRFYRPDIVLAVVKGKAADALSGVDPALEGNAARYYDLTFTADNSLAKTVTTVRDYFSHNSCVLPLISGTAVDGIAYIKKGKLVALGDSMDAMCYNLLTKGTKQSVFADALIKSKPPAIKEVWRDNAPTVNYSVTVDISPLEKGVKLAKVQQELESTLKAFVSKVTYDYKTDVLNTESLFKKYSLTENELKKQDWEELFNNISVNVSVTSTENKKGRSAVN